MILRFSLGGVSADNNYEVCFKQKLTIFLFLMSGIPILAQTQRPDSAEVSFVQRLSWDADPNVFRYEVTIEREEGGVVERRDTTNSYIEVSLQPGRYRYTVDVYDLLDLFDYRMATVSFEVLEALQPVVTGLLPKVLNLADGGNEVVLSGEHLAEDVLIFLIRNGTQGNHVVPAEVQVLSGGTSARIVLPLNEIEKGTWTIYVTNPGGFSAVVPGFRIKNSKRTGIGLSALYSPLIPIRAENDHLFGLELFPGSSFLFDTILIKDFYQGGALKLEWFPAQPSLFNLGFFIEPYLANLETDLGYATTNPYLFSLSISLALRILLLNNHLALDISAGGGLLALFNFRMISSDTGVDTGYDSLYQPFLDTGVSIKIYPAKSFFLELGAAWNVTYPFSNPDFQFLKPRVGVGYSF
jgi:hypothetical protein